MVVPNLRETRLKELSGFWTSLSKTGWKFFLQNKCPKRHNAKGDNIMNYLTPIEREGQRVLLTAQLAESYETTSDVISKNFNRNQERYEAGKHYFVLEGDEKRDFLNRGQFDDGLKKAARLYLWTQRGALLHAKSLNTDRAWEVYDELVETYFRAKSMQANLSNLSPQLQLLINMEMEQKRQAEQLATVEQKVDGIRELVAINPNGWREDCRKLIARIAQTLGGMAYIRDVNTEVYDLVDARAGVSLATRLTNKRRRMADEGVCKSTRDKLSKVDVIADDKKLIEIYIKVVRELAVKHEVL
nr:MAG TPA: hypothetical protein [Caudoviricetes sp.]